MAGSNFTLIFPMKSLVILEGARTPLCRAGSVLADMHAGLSSDASQLLAR